MATRLLGLETEYGFAVLPGPPPADLDHLAVRLLDLFGRQTICLPPVNGNGWFLANGGRMYVDAGRHPEFATPEVDNPFDAVRYMLAGDRLLEEAAASWSTTQTDRRRMFLFKSNVDHLTGATWACHESYGHRMDPRRLPADLIPHLVSRIICTGAGGLLPGGESLQFCLSPRARHLVNEISPESTSGRGIFHLKDENLAGPEWHRLHVLCGESLWSHRASVLKLGTTALVLALAEAGLRPGALVQFRRPLEALEAFNLDLEGRATARLVDGRRFTAHDVQSHYLSLAQAYLEHDFMPPWAPRIWLLWAETLDRLRQGPAGVATTLDWGLKFALHTQHLRQRGCEPAQCERWNRATFTPATTLPAPDGDPHDTFLLSMSRRPPDPAVPAVCDPGGFTTAEINTFRRVRAELAELEIRFGQLGPGGLFRTLDAQGLLEHRVDEGLGEAGVREAMRTPPAHGRAGVRGRLIRELATLRVPCACEWQSIRERSGRYLDLSDPLIEAPPPWISPQSPTEGHSLVSPHEVV